MSWFSRRRSSAPPPPHGATEEATETPAEIHPSPGLQALLAELEEGGAYRILDLGAARGDNVEFFSRYAARLQIADLWSSLTADATLRVRAEEHPGPVLQHLLPPVDGGDFHVVLAWDLFDYLSRDQLRALGILLERLTRPGGHLLALLPAGREIPARPRSFRVLDGGRLEYGARCAESRTSPRYAPADLGALLPRFAVDRSFLLRHGVQEYLFRREVD